MIAFTFGGFGGAINAAYAMNSMVHNTAWIMGHFHVTLGTTVALTFMGATYWLLPRILGRELRFKPLAQAQPYLWFAGMVSKYPRPVLLAVYIIGRPERGICWLGRI